MSTRSCLSLGLITVIFCASAQEWQSIPEEQQRLERPAIDLPESSAEPGQEPESDTDLDPDPDASVLVNSDDGFYNQGKGQIDGAFGMLFTDPLPEELIKRNLGWVAVPKLPASLAYIGDVKPFDLPAYSVSSASIQKILGSARVRVTVYLDFDNRPLWIHAEAIPKIDKIIKLLRRKYGKPDRETDRLIRFDRSPNQLVITLDRSSSSLDYYALQSLGTYLDHRNRSLRTKHNQGEKVRLNASEKTILQLADHMVELRQDMNQVFGLPFGKRVGFLAKPDEFVEFTPLNPLSGIIGGEYQVMVSPDLNPVMMRYELSGSGEYLLKQKMIFDHALKIAFGGFLKHKPRHSVLTMAGNSISTMVREGKFSLTIIDGVENKKYNERWKIAELARQLAEEARKEREEMKIAARLALEAKRKREREISEETGL